MSLCDQLEGMRVVSKMELSCALESTGKDIKEIHSYPYVVLYSIDDHIIGASIWELLHVLDMGYFLNKTTLIPPIPYHIVIKGTENGGEIVESEIPFPEGFSADYVMSLTQNQYLSALNKCTMDKALASIVAARSV